jgi:acyl dehydratase
MPESRKTPTAFKKLTYDAVQVGDEFVSDDHLVIPEDIQAHSFAVEDDHPWLAESMAPPTLMANQALHLRHSQYIVHAGLHAKMEFNFLEPIQPGIRVRTRGKVIDKYERRSKPYMVTEYVTEDETGAVLVRGQFTQMIIPEPEAPHDHAR